MLNSLYKKYRIFFAPTLIFAYFLISVLTGRTFYANDIFWFHIPWRHFARSQFIQGHIPLWNPYILGGMPLLAHGQSGLLSPINAIFILLIKNQFISYSLNLIFYYILGYTGFYMFLHKKGANKNGSTVGALIFTFSGFALNHGIHINIIGTLMLFPFLLLSIEHFNEAKALRWKILFVVTAVLQILSYHPQLFIITASGAFLYAILQAKTIRESINAGLLVILLFIIAAFLALPQILPSFQLIFKSERSHIAKGYNFIVKDSMPIAISWLFLIFQYPFRYPAYVVPFFFGEIFLTITGLGLFVSGIGKIKRRSTIVFLCLIAAGVLMAFPDINPLYHLFATLPIIGSIRAPVRWWILSIVGISYFAGMGFKQGIKVKRLRIFSAVVLLFVCLYIIFALTNAGNRGFYSLLDIKNPANDVEIIISMLLFVFAFAVPAKMFVKTQRGVLYILLFIELLFTQAMLLKTQRLRNIEHALYVPTKLDKEHFYLSQSPQGLDSTELLTFFPYQQMNLKNYFLAGTLFPGDFLMKYGYKNLGGYVALQMVPHFIQEMYFKLEVLESKGDTLHIRQLFKNLGIKYYFTPKKNLYNSCDDFKKIDDMGPCALFKVKDSVPAYYFCPRIDTDSQDSTLWYNLMTDEYQTMPAVIEKISDKPQKLIFEIQNNQPGYLYIKQRWYPEWACTVDGKRTEVLKADGYFTAVRINSPGSHRVVFRYSGKMFKAGVYMSILMLLFLMLYIKISRKGNSLPA